MVNTKKRSTRYEILMEIARHPQGITIPELVERTGISYQVINNILKKEEIGKFFTESHKTINKTSTGIRESLSFKIGNGGRDEDTLEELIDAYYERLNEKYNEEP